MSRNKDRAGSPGASSGDKETAPGPDETPVDENTAVKDDGEKAIEAASVAPKTDGPLRTQLEEAQCKAQENLSLLHRVAADYDNYKKFAEREKGDAVLKERSILLCEFIDVMENLERAIEAGKKELPAQSGLMKGLQMTLEGIRKFMECQGVRPIEAAGRKFDPQLHDAVYFISAPGKPEYTVAEELGRGYTINGKVLRTSKVSVVSRPELPEGCAPCEENKTG